MPVDTGDRRVGGTWHGHRLILVGFRAEGAAYRPLRGGQLGRRAQRLHDSREGGRVTVGGQSRDLGSRYGRRDWRPTPERAVPGATSGRAFIGLTPDRADRSLQGTPGRTTDAAFR